MPHDKNGTELHVGDLVSVTAKVTSVSPSEDQCNVSMEVQGPDEQYRPSMTCNSKLVAKVGVILLALLAGAICCASVQAQDCPGGVCALRSHQSNPPAFDDRQPTLALRFDEPVEVPCRSSGPSSHVPVQSSLASCETSRWRVANVAKRLLPRCRCR